MDELTARKQQILRAVVLEYVESAEPVGSSLLVERYQLGVGSATVRHELAEMSERGYLEQPHTSAGRIPSDVGYRYYVDNLSEPKSEPLAERKVKEISRTDIDLEDLLSETCKVLSRLTHYVSMATTVGERVLSIRGVTLTGVTKEKALLAVVLSNGIVESKLVNAGPDITLNDLHEITVAIGTTSTNLKLKAITRAPVPDFGNVHPRARELALASWKALKSVCKALTASKVVTEGTQYLFEQPEFQQDVSALGKIVSALEQEDTVSAVLQGDETGTAVRIGRENPSEALQRVAIIAGRFYIGDDEAGAIAIAGPTRMRYSSTVPLVETAAKALSEALSRFFK